MAFSFVPSAYRVLSFTLVFSSLAVALKPAGTTIYVNDIAYFIPPTIETTLSLPSGFNTNQGWLPMTAVVGSVTSATFKNFTATDDVFQKAFEKVLLVQGGQNSGAKVDIAINTIFTTKHTKVPAGPYFLNAENGDVHQAWRLYSDTIGAFTETLFGNGDGTFSVLAANIPGQHLAVAVPSRLYYTQTKAQPLAGYRIGVKDIYDVAGARKSNGNRAYYHLYPAANTSAVAVQKLIDAGAIVVGKMITSQFANGESATADWVDYHESFNPRGDGYQQPSSSSSGPGAGEGAYPWLDITLGSDTGGSIRGPCQVQGLYGNRPSHGAVDLTGVMPLSPAMDTAGFLARDPTIWRAFAEVMYAGNPDLKQYSAYPKTIYTISVPTSADGIVNGLIVDFMAKLTKFLTGNVTAIDYEAMFTANPPADSPTSDFNALVGETYSALISGQQIELLRDPFFADYAAAYDGRTPAVDPTPLYRWDWADNQTSSLVSDGLTNQTIFTNWFQENVLIPDYNSTSCSNAIAVYVGSTAAPDYRNVYTSGPSFPFGWGDWALSPIVSNPDYVIPIGQAPYNSTITNHVEYLPVTMDIMAAKGCDFMLFDLIRDLEQAGIVGVSAAGRTNVDGGEILYKRGKPAF